MIALSGAQALGANAVLVRAAVEGIGVGARALGQRYNADGRLLRAALLPLLERGADRCPSVAAAAAASLGALCIACGYDGVATAVAANSDYIVDGLCRQLRHLDSHPQ